VVFYPKEIAQLVANMIQVLDFGAIRDGVPDENRGRRVVVNHKGREIDDVESLPDAQAVMPV